MSIKPPRRIFMRQKRRHGTLITLRAVGMLAAGFLLAFGATVATFDGPGPTPSSHMNAQQEPQTLPGHTPTLRLAATSVSGARRQ